jgi:hypothetical protein
VALFLILDKRHYGIAQLIAAAAWNPPDSCWPPEDHDRGTEAAPGTRLQCNAGPALYLRLGSGGMDQGGHPGNPWMRIGRHRRHRDNQTVARLGQRIRCWSLQWFLHTALGWDQQIKLVKQVITVAASANKPCVFIQAANRVGFVHSELQCRDTVIARIVNEALHQLATDRQARASSSGWTSANRRGPVQLRSPPRSRGR